MPVDPKYAKGRLTIHLDELIDYANNFRNSTDPLMQMMQRVLIDYNAYAGVDEAGRLNVHQRLKEQVKKRANAKAKAPAK